MLNMFGHQWWQHKSKSKELGFGWLYNNSIKDDFARGYTKNLTDYWSMELGFYFHEQMANDTIEGLLENAVENKYKKILVFKQGTTPLSNFKEQFVQFYEDNKDATFIGHIVDKGDEYYSLHPQAFMIDVDWWIKAGKPAWGSPENKPLEAIEPARSISNWHDDYTPHWIGPGKNNKTYNAKHTGWNLVKSLLDDQQRIVSWNKNIRDEKHYSYPEIKEDGPRHLSGVMEQIDLDIFFIANTEPLRDIHLEVERRKLQYPEWDEKWDTLVVPAAGLTPLIYAFELGCDKYSKILVYDISKFAINITKTIIEKWDGTNYEKFATDLMNQLAPDEKYQRDIFRGKNKLPHTQEVFDKLNERGFQEWITNVLPEIEVVYLPINIFDPNTYQGFVNSFKTDRLRHPVTFCYLSNIFHYLPTSFYYSLQQRWELHNELMGKIKDSSYQNNVLVLSSRGTLTHPNLVWIDKQEMDKFTEIPDNYLQKLLKWNKNV